MDVNQAIRVMLYNNHVSMRSASIAMGRTPSYLGNTLSRPGDVGAGVVAECAAACGHVLALVPADSIPDDALIIDQAARRGLVDRRGL